MSKRLEFYYDFGSPNAYMAWKVLSDTEGLSLDMKPALIGGIFKSTNNQPPWQAFSGVPAKMKYMTVELQRFVSLYGLTEYKFNPHFPVMTILPMRAAIVSVEEGTHDSFYPAVFSAMWEQGLDVSNPAVLAGVLDKAGLEGDRMVARTQDQSIKDALMAATAEAVNRGVFGLPTWFDGAEIYFGKDCCWMMGAKPVQMP